MFIMLERYTLITAEVNGAGKIYGEMLKMETQNLMLSFYLTKIGMI